MIIDEPMYISLGRRPPAERIRGSLTAMLDSDKGSPEFLRAVVGLALLADEFEHRGVLTIPPDIKVSGGGI